MGVTQLWQILAPVEQHKTLSSLKGQTLAVDLSIWVCENQCVKQMQGVVSKPYLRNLFFRISHLTQLGVKLVFVIEGSAPELKWDTMIKRQQSRFPGRQGKQPQQRPAGKQTRRNFNSWLKECCELLEILGIPYIQSKGEAEALCALLNAAGDPHVEMYHLEDIQSKLSIDRGGLIALGLLIGCDFVPKGVPGIGAANAVRLLQSLQGQDILHRLKSWKTITERDCVDQAEVLARRKAVQVIDFPHVKVIEEFLVPKDRCPSRLPQWKRPVPAKLQDFALIKLEWPVEYTIEKILPLVTLWDMQDLRLSRNPSVHQHLKPNRIVKTRIRQGDPCFEVEWIKPVTDAAHDGSFYVTIELQEMFAKCYPEVTQAYLAETTEQKKKPKGKKKKKKADTQADAPLSLDNLSFQFEKVNIGRVTSHLQESAKDLHPSFTEYDETALTTKAKQPRHLTLSPNAKKPASKSENVESRKAIVFPQSMSQETDPGSTKDVLEEAFVSLSQRVKLRMQNKHGSNKENESKTSVEEPKVSVGKSPGGDLSNMSSLLEDIQNLSLKEQGKFRNKMKENQVGKGKCSYDRSPETLASKCTPSFMSKKFSCEKDSLKMSSPNVDSVCSPMTYMKHQAGLGESFEIQKSPYYIKNPWEKAKSDKDAIDFSSPGFFARPDAIQEPEEVDTRSTAEKLIEKLESGIGGIGNKSSVHVEHKASSGLKAAKGNHEGENLTVDSLMSILNGSEKSSGTPSHKLGCLKTATPGNLSVSGLDSTSLSQFGDFQIQHSLLNSLCSSLVQALTPKGMTMTKEEYEKLVTTLNVLESDDNESAEEADAVENFSAEDPVCNIDFSELANASKSIRNMNQKLLLRPIQIDDEDVMAKLSKSARRKLRRRERKMEQELQIEANVQKNSNGKQKTNNTREKQTKKNQSAKVNNLQDTSKTDIANVKNSKRKPDKSKSAMENGACPLATKNSNEKVKSDCQILSSQKTNTRKSGNPELASVQNCDQTDDPKTVEEQNEEVVEKTKKKRKKKKKVKKASPLIDISADESIYDKKEDSCAEYLKKALENNQRVVLENKIVKASPYMDFSADETLLDLQEISCKIAGEELDEKLNSKLNKKKKLMKERVSNSIETSQTGTIPEAPVLSVKNVFSNDLHNNERQNSHCCTCGKQGTPAEEKSSGHIVAEGNGDMFISGNKLKESKQSELGREASGVDGLIGNINFDVNLAAEENDKSATSVANFSCLVETNASSEVNENDNATKDIIGDAVSVFTEVENNERESKGDMIVVEPIENDDKNGLSELENGYKNTHQGIETIMDCYGGTTFATELDGIIVNTGKLEKQNDIEHVNNLPGYVYGDPVKICKLEAEYVGNPERVENGSLKYEIVVENDKIYTDLTRSSSEIEVNDVKVEIDSEDARNNVNDENSCKTPSVYQPIANDLTYIGLKVNSPNKDTNGLHGPKLENGGHNSLVFDNETDSDEVFKSCKNSCMLNGEYNSINIPDMKEEAFENEMNGCAVHENNGANVNIDSDVEDVDKATVKDEAIFECSVIQKSVNIRANADDMTEDIGIRYGSYEKVSKSGYEFCVEKSKDDERTWNMDGAKSEVIQSPACLADRLKMKLRKTSTRNVLDKFTNGN